MMQDFELESLITESEQSQKVKPLRLLMIIVQKIAGLTNGIEGHQV